MKTGLLISGYHSLSQASWIDFIVEEMDHINWSVVKLPPRYFSWRMRGNPLSVAELEPILVSQAYDIILATASVDLATIQSIYPALRNTPSILYFHDNQFEYPKANNPQSVVDWQITNIYSAMRADRLIFNSQYNRDSFIRGVQQLMKKMPDLAPKKLHDTLLKKSNILPVPIIEPELTAAKQTSSTLTVLWNHRWEWDKCPELLETTLDLLDSQQVPINFIITGQQFRNQPESFKRIQHSRIVNHCAFIEDEKTYQSTLTQCDVVLSTAIHEFQGIAVLEAVAAGCVPLLPDRLSYPEMFDPQFLYSGQGSNEDQAERIVSQLKKWQARGLPTLPNVSAYFRSKLADKYRKNLEYVH